MEQVPDAGSPLRIAVLGGGVMGETLATGFLRRQPTPDVVVAEKREERVQELRSQGLLTADAVDAVRGARAVVLVVKPQDTVALLQQMGQHIEPGAVVISIAAGIRTETVESAVRPGVDVVRAMPNTPARVDRGMTGISPGQHCTPAGLELAADLMSSVGLVVSVPEELQDAVTAVSGSGPAYVFFLAEAMTAAAVDLGLDVATATTMVNQTILGAASLLEASDEDAAELRRKVTSPQGTTAAAIAVLEDRDAGVAVQDAVRAAAARSRELSGG